MRLRHKKLCGATPLQILQMLDIKCKSFLCSTNFLLWHISYAKTKCITFSVKSSELQKFCMAELLL